MQLASYGNLRNLQLRVHQTEHLPPIQANTIRELLRRCANMVWFEFAIRFQIGQQHQKVPVRFTPKEIADFLQLSNVVRHKQKNLRFVMILATADANRKNLRHYLDEAILRRSDHEQHNGHYCKWIVWAKPIQFIQATSTPIMLHM
jgi:hypothetical protein